MTEWTQANRTPLAVGDYVYQQGRRLPDDTRASLAIRVKRIRKDSFVTEDDRVWRIGKYDDLKDYSFTQRGSTRSYVYRLPSQNVGHLAEVVIDAAKYDEIWAAHNAELDRQKRAEKAAKLAEVGIAGFVNQLVWEPKYRGLGPRGDLRQFRRELETETQREEYCVALEDTVADLHRQLERVSGRLSSLASSVSNAASDIGPGR